MDKYIENVLPLARIDKRQIRNFARFVAGAHSWYKHLPHKLPGAEFYFYLDPNSCRNIIRTNSGDIAFVDITDADTPFHYTWQTTNTYRQRFGYWNYHTNRGSSVMLFQKTAGGIMSTGKFPLKILSMDGDWLHIPESLARCAKVMINAFVHPLALDFVEPEPEYWKEYPPLIYQLLEKTSGVVHGRLFSYREFLELWELAIACNDSDHDMVILLNWLENSANQQLYTISKKIGQFSEIQFKQGYSSQSPIFRSLKQIASAYDNSWEAWQEIIHEIIKLYPFLSDSNTLHYEKLEYDSMIILARERNRQIKEMEQAMIRFAEQANRFAKS